jgi:type IV secretory pathway VirB3-like protein
MGNTASRAALEDVVFLALQRPAMLLGCPTEGVMVNLAVSVPAGGWTSRARNSVCHHYERWQRFRPDRR